MIEFHAVETESPRLLTYCMVIVRGCPTGPWELYYFALGKCAASGLAARSWDWNSYLLYLFVWWVALEEKKELVDQM